MRPRKSSQSLSSLKNMTPFYPANDHVLQNTGRVQSGCSWHNRSNTTWPAACKVVYFFTEVPINPPFPASAALSSASVFLGATFLKIIKAGTKNSNTVPNQNGLIVLPGLMYEISI